MTEQPPAQLGADADADAVARPQRSALAIFTQSTLMLEALTTFFAALVAWSLAKAGALEAAPVLVWFAGIGLASLFALASAMASRSAGRAFGWGLQGVLILAGLILPAAAIMGVVFLGVYALGVRWGTRIDRERAERSAAHAGEEAS